MDEENKKDDQPTGIAKLWTGTSSRSGIYARMTDAFDSWLTCIIDDDDDGTHLTSARVFGGKEITETVYKMEKDGLIGTWESLELRGIGNTWMRLFCHYTLNRTGRRHHRREVISCLLELFSSALISEDLCIDVCAHL